MAKKKGDEQRARRAAARERAFYEELDKYPVLPPHARSLASSETSAP